MSQKKVKHEWEEVNAFEPKSYPKAETRYLFELKQGFRFFGWFDGELVRSFLKIQKGRHAGEPVILAPLSKVSRFCEDGTTDIFHDGILR